LKNKSEYIVFACSGGEVDELKNQFKNNEDFNIKVCEEVEELDKIKDYYPQASVVAISSYGNQAESAVSDLYGNLFSGLRFVNVENMYEDLFGRVPISIISQKWFLDHISIEVNPVYELFKRVTDLLAGFLIGMVFFVIMPFIYIFIKLDDAGTIFFNHTRICRFGQPFELHKIR